MNSTVNFGLNGARVCDVNSTSVMSVVSASRRILAASDSRIQGIRLSSLGGDLGLQVFASKVQGDKQIVMKQDKPMGGWQPSFAYASTGADVAEAGAFEPAHLLAARPRTHSATVIKSRHRSRLR
ncbi:hypothetical protein LTV02_20060 [Nocardia yamanashiensis]|uniref:hypothetical protein n=1 Tax=Nocardia yamanashiensis TaxID=209247 RepID=UPI00082E31C8|nr:hypothetical protein [Nocardia yamanashiensis]UGT45541.1 hypothetical protein LTV02_20060 [Nocardia yamanashiensis]